MSKQDSERYTDETHTAQTRSRRRFLAGALTGGLLGSLLAGTLSVYAQTFQGFGGCFRAGHGYCRARHVGSHDPAVVGERVARATDRSSPRRRCPLPTA